MGEQIKNSKEFIINFLEIYKKHPALWKIKSQDYKNRNLKNKGYEELLTLYKSYYTLADKNSVLKKIQSLRGAFRKELKKVESSKRSGKSTDEIYVPSLWYYDLLLFTLEHELPTSSVDSIVEDISFLLDEIVSADKDTYIEEENSNSNTQIIPTTASKSTDLLSSISSTPSANKKLKRNIEGKEQTDFLRTCTEVLRGSRAEKDQYDILGQYVASKMKCLQSEHQKIFAEGLIMQALQKAALNKLSENSSITETPSGSQIICVTPTPSTPQDFYTEDASNIFMQ